VMMTSFKRARSEEQRTQRSLNELSRRVGLAKSNVLRYFESREAVLLELLDAALQEWLAQLHDALTAAVNTSAAASERGDQLATTLAVSLTTRPMLCDLISTQAAVLEHNVSPQVAAQYKRAAIANVGVLSGLIRQHLPELGERDAQRLAVTTILLTSAVWTYARPAAAMLAAYQADPSLATMRFDFTTTLRETLEVLITGLLARLSR
jgi:AcrR family transcriptional regulator